MSLFETQRLGTATAIDAFCCPVSAKTTWVLIRLSFSQGVTGWGEATLFGSESEVASLAKALGERLKGNPASDLAALLSPIRQSNMAGARGVLASALEQAWFDGLSRTASTPLNALFGGAERDAVPFYANINRGISDRSPEGFTKQARAMVAATGAKAIKIAPFDGFRWDQTTLDQQTELIDLGLQRVAAVKTALVDGQRLFVDCHARFNPFLSRSLFRELGALSVSWVEDPCAMQSLSATEQRSVRHAANSAGLLLAGAETVTELQEMALLLECEGHDVVLPDLRFTGIANGIAMLRLAAARQVAVSIHNPVGPVLDAISTHVALSLPSFLILERQIGESKKFDKIRRGEADCRNGAVYLSGHPGLGFEPDLEMLEPLDGSPPENVLSFNRMAGAGPDS